MTDISPELRLMSRPDVASLNDRFESRSNFRYNRLTRAFRIMMPRLVATNKDTMTTESMNKLKSTIPVKSRSPC